MKIRFDPQDMLGSLRWDADMVIENYDGERVWLKPCLDDAGKRIGITECCPEAWPCKRHKRLAVRATRAVKNRRVFFLGRGKYRWLAVILNIHRVHHIRWSFGYVFRPLRWGYFPIYGWQRVKPSEYHDCTATGRY